MPKTRSDLLQGTLDLLILKTLSLGENHGWGIARRIKQVSRDVFAVNQGSLYPALQRLEQQGSIESYWAPSENNRRAKFYRLTSVGDKKLSQQTANWNEVSAAIARILALS